MKNLYHVIIKKYKLHSYKIMRGHLFSKVQKFLDPAKYSEKILSVGKVNGKKAPGRVSVAVQLNNSHLNMVYTLHKCLH